MGMTQAHIYIVKESFSHSSRTEERLDKFREYLMTHFKFHSRAEAVVFPRRQLSIEQHSLRVHSPPCHRRFIALTLSQDKGETLVYHILIKKRHKENTYHNKL